MSCQMAHNCRLLHLSSPARPPFRRLTSPPSDLPQNIWVWNVEDGQRMYYDNHEMVRFRVIDESWHDQTPTKPLGRGEEAEERRKPPYMIKGSMKDPGLGVCLWWDE